MEIILLENIVNVGKLGDLVEVKNGYARNFLIPKGKAKPATEANKKDFEVNRAEFEKRMHEKLSQAEQLQTKVNGQTIVVLAAASEEGNLYGSVGTYEIAQALEEAGFAIDKSQVLLPNGVFKSTGSFEVELAIMTGTQATITLEIKDAKLKS